MYMLVIVNFKTKLWSLPWERKINNIWQLEDQTTKVDKLSSPVFPTLQTELLWYTIGWLLPLVLLKRVLIGWRGVGNTAGIIPTGRKWLGYKLILITYRASLSISHTHTHSSMFCLYTYQEKITGKVRNKHVLLESQEAHKYSKCMVLNFNTESP